MLGFDNREKLGLFQAQAQELAATITRLGREIETLADQDKNRATRAMQCQTLVNLQWQEIDVIPLLDRIFTIERQIREAREGNTALLHISERIDKQKHSVDQADKDLRDAKVAHDSVLKQINDSTQKLESLLQDAFRVPLTPHQIKGLDERFTKQSDAIRLESLDKVATAVERGLNTEIGEIKDEIGDCEKEIEARFPLRCGCGHNVPGTMLALRPDTDRRLAMVMWSPPLRRQQSESCASSLPPTLTHAMPSYSRRPCNCSEVSRKWAFCSRWSVNCLT